MGDAGVAFEKRPCRPVEFKECQCHPVEFKTGPCRPVNFKKYHGIHAPCQLSLNPVAWGCRLGTGEGGGLQNGRGGARKVLPLRKGGGGRKKF